MVNISYPILSFVSDDVQIVEPVEDEHAISGRSPLARKVRCVKSCKAEIAFNHK
jgi:hypothetical protein